LMKLTTINVFQKYERKLILLATSKLDMFLEKYLVNSSFAARMHAP